MQSEPLRVPKPFVSWTADVSSKAPYSAVLKRDVGAIGFCFFVFFFPVILEPFGFSVYFFGVLVFLKSLFRVQFCSQIFPDGDGFQVPTYPHHIRTSVSLLAQ